MPKERLRRVSETAEEGSYSVTGSGKGIEPGMSARRQPLGPSTLPTEGQAVCAQNHSETCLHG